MTDKKSEEIEGKTEKSGEGENSESGTENASTGNSKPSNNDGDILRREIRRILREELRNVGGTSTGGKSRDIEAEAKAAVEQEAKKLAAEKAHEEEHAALKRKPDTENSPVKLRKLTQFLWGEK